MMNISTISKNKKLTLIIVFLSVALVSLTIGYALMSSNLKINTTGMVTPASWRIHFIDSSSTTQGSATVSGLPEKTDTTELSYNCTLTKPGDQCRVDATIKNDGDINAKLALITKLDPTYTGTDEDIALMKENTVYNVKYNNIDSSTILSKNPTLTPGSEATVTIVFGYKSEATTLPSNTISVSNLGLQLLYEQINTSDNNNPQGEEDILYRRLIAKEASDKTYETGIKEISAKGNPDFSEISTTDDGMYAMKDDVGTSYYYRGAVPDNWVSFAGYLWRVIRVNGDNTVRMIYSGTKASHTGEGTQIGESTFNSSHNSPKYVGYMYGDTDATEEDAFTNKNNSTIKGVIDTGYQNILSSYSGYSGYLADEVFCNDRTLASTSTYRTSNNFDYAGWERLYTNKTPQLTCPNLARDGFTTTTSSIGNKALTYPIGLITADEVSLAGGVYGTSNSSYYLYTGQWYWALSAGSWFSGGAGYAGVFLVASDGGLYNGVGDFYYDNGDVFNSFGVRPVVSLRTSTLVTSGTGTETDPYVIE